MKLLFDAVPLYHDYGFAVFQLDASQSRGATQVIQPMAMRFPTRAPDRLFFPTVHVHDGSFAPKARFDHALYYQTPRAEGVEPQPYGLGGDEISWMNPTRDYEGRVATTQPVVRRKLRGRRPNQDTWIDA